MSDTRPANRLVHETSPYLLQHAHNPVDWYPWGPEALERARSEDRPILLSIGYAACHWCHVMEHESFEDDETARFMNEHFVCVKVDREERPDLDAIYMDAVQAMTGHGGWPMTVFLSPDGSPFYAGTYFPKQDSHGLPSFRKVLEAVAHAWREQRADLEHQGQRVVQAVGRATAAHASAEPISEPVLRQAHAGLARVFDERWGGFGGAPKFPQPMTLEFLLRCELHGYPGSLEMVRRTLDRMAAGGVYDQVGGGFHRYSVDERWHVPHFEKMLYDNAQLAQLYLHAWQLTGEPRYERVCRETLEYLLREMRHPSGGFFSSQDADSEGEEGRFFVWRHDELLQTVRAALRDERLAEAVAAAFGAVPEGNWEGTNVLWMPVPLASVAESTGVTADDLSEALGTARRVLFDARSRRVAPGTDDKVLASWNGLAIRAFAEAGRFLDEPRYVDAAVAATEFVLSELRTDDGRLLRGWRDGRRGRPGYLDDHAMMAAACLAVYETTFEARFFAAARGLADDMLRLFRDHDGGGFFQTGSDAEALVVRPKDVFDNAVPSGNSVAAEVLLRLSLMTGEPDYEAAAVSALALVRDLVERAPTGFGHALSAADLYVSTPREIAIVGDPAAQPTRALIAEARRRFSPNTVIAVGGPGSGDEEIPLLRDRPMVAGRPTAYVCERFACQQPVTEPAALAAQLA